MKNWRLLFVALLMLIGCGRTMLPKPEEAFRAARPLKFADDLGVENFRQALRGQLAFYAQHPCGQRKMVFGAREIACDWYQRTLEQLSVFLEKNPSESDITDYLAQNFEVLEVYGRADWGEVLLTSYFEPVIFGASQQTETYSQPLYATPADLYFLKPEEFGWEGNVRRVRVEGRRILPYFSRFEIDSEKRISQGTEVLAWVDPIDAFFLQIQGSGTVKMEGGDEVVLGYAERNGHPYVALAAALKDQPIERPITMSSLRKYLRNLDGLQRQKAMNLNPSYVFFKKNAEHAVTKLGIPAIAGRSIATDPAYFPKGALAYLETSQALGEQSQGRFVLDHDIGGAIKGPGRVDLFWGAGVDAGESAGKVNGTARLFYFVPKSASP